MLNLTEKAAQAARKPLNLVNQIRDFVVHRQEIHHFVKASFHSSESWGAMGSVQENEYPLLKELCEEASRYPGPIIEIGTLFGFATTKLALWRAKDKEVITVDNYSWNPCGLPPHAHFQLTSRVLEFLTATGQVKQLKIDKQRFFDTYGEGRPSMVFMDADHSYEETKKDIGWARKVGAPIICGHDYAPECPAVRRAVDEAGGPARLQGSLWALSVK